MEQTGTDIGTSTIAALFMVAVGTLAIVWLIFPFVVMGRLGKLWSELMRVNSKLDETNKILARLTEWEEFKYKDRHRD